MTASRSKSSASEYEWDMYIPFAEAMNYTLEHLSTIQVAGLPEFKNHIAFVPCNKKVQSNRVLPGSEFKPDIAVMSIQDAYEFHQLDKINGPKLSEFITRISGESPAGLTNWNTVLSAIEMKRKEDGRWVELGKFDHEERQISIMQDADERLHEKPEDSQPATRRSDAFS